MFLIKGLAAMMAAIGIWMVSALPAFAADRYVVVFKDLPEAASEVAREAARHHAVHRYQAVFNGFAAELSPQALAALQKHPLVQAIEPEFEVRLVADSVPTGVDRVDAELAHVAGAMGIGARVAVVDTGVDYTHVDLQDRVNVGLSRTFVSFESSTSNGFDDHGHGTHVAGTVAASANGTGVVGVAPGAEIVTLKVLSASGLGSSLDIMAALDYITQHNNNAASYADMIHIANFSLGGGGGDSDSAFRRAFERTVASGCFIAAAAGNGATDAAYMVPAAYDSVFTVSAMDSRNDSFASFSNYGMDVDMTAPGVAILSSFPGQRYASYSGTSMAAPHVAGGAALYVAGNLGQLTRANAEHEIRLALLSSAEPIVMSGDKDGIAEPLLDAQAVVGDIAPPAPELRMGISLDKATYSEADAQAVLTITLVTELGAAVTGLSANAFDLGAMSHLRTGFSERGDGRYALTVDISAFTPDRDYRIDVMVTDGRGLSASQGVSLQRVSLAPLHIGNISYDVGKRNLKVKVAVADARGNRVSGAYVYAAIFHNGSLLEYFNGPTNRKGELSHSLRRPANGHYTTTIYNIIKDGTRYDSGSDAADPGVHK